MSMNNVILDSAKALSYASVHLKKTSLWVKPLKSFNTSLSLGQNLARTLSIPK